jgi:hypothetical protein
MLLRKLCVHYANGFDNVKSVYLFYSNPVLRAKELFRKSKNQTDGTRLRWNKIKTRNNC